MSNNAKEKIIDYIKAKECFSIPMIQNDLSLDYGIVREVICELEGDEKVTFLEGIVYKWTAPKDENNNNEKEDDSKIAPESPFSRFFKNHLSRRQETDEIKDNKDEDGGDAVNFVDSVFRTRFESTGNFLQKKRLLESNGGPFPEYPKNDLSLIQYISLQRDAEDAENAFLPRLDVHIPEINKRLVIHTGDSPGLSFFHDNGLLAEYIKSKALGLDSAAISRWHDLVEDRIDEIGVCGSYSEGVFRYYVPDSADYKRYSESLSTFIDSISKSIEYVNMTIKKKGTKDLLEDFRNIRSKHDDIADKILASDISFDDLTEFIEKVIEIEPTATAETVSRIFTKCSIKASVCGAQKRAQIISFCNKARYEYRSAVTVYFLLKQVQGILDSDE